MYSLKEGLHILKNNFGTNDVAKTLTKVMKNSVKLARNREQCRFLVKCRRLLLIPVFILNCVRLPAVNERSHRSVNYVNRFRRLMLNEAISNLHSEQAYLCREARRTPFYLSSVPLHTHGWFLHLCANICQRETKESDIRLTKRLQKLINKQTTISTSSAPSPRSSHRVNDCSKDGCSDTARQLLSKGPKFAITPQVNSSLIREAEVGVEKLAFSLRWKQAIMSRRVENRQRADDNSSDSTEITDADNVNHQAESQISNRDTEPASQNQPQLRINFSDTPKSQPPRVDYDTEDRLSRLKQEVLETYKKRRPENAHKQTSNISSKEVTALKDLKKKEGIIIKPSDKCQRFVVLDKEEYAQKANDLLKDSDSYAVLRKDPTTKVEAEVKSALNGLEHAPVTKRLAPITNWRCPVWYGLPKDHKPAMPLRPIVSNCGSPTEKPSFLLERILTQLLQFVPAHLSSSDDFLEKFRSKYPTSLPPDSFLFTMDVSSLYTNIPIKEAIPMICDMIQRHIEAIITYGLTVKEIEHLLEVCLENSYFRFDDTFYQQKKGVAMGNKMGPPVAILFLHHLELEVRASAPLQPDFYGRYIDDLLGVWCHGQEAFEEFQAHMNGLHENIKFTTDREDDAGSVPFLDIRITRHSDQSYTTELFVKPTHSGITLHYDSAHPKRTKENTLENELRRAVRLSSDDQATVRSIQKIHDIFEQNGYPRKLIDRVTAKVRRSQTRNRPRQKEKHVGPFLQLPFVNDEHSRQVERLVKTSRLPCRIAWSNRRTLRRELTSSDMRGPTCALDRGRCLACEAGLDSRCGVGNVVYEVTCSLCKESYIGECIRPVRERFLEHRRASFKRDDQNPVGLHFKKYHTLDVLPEIPITCKIIQRCKDHVGRKLSETILIRERRPNLNKNVASWYVM